MLNIGAKSAFLAQLCWQLRHHWDKPRMLAAWHRNHPDISDDIFEELYTLAVRCCKCLQMLRDPFGWQGTIGELWMKAK